MDLSCLGRVEVANLGGEREQLENARKEITGDVFASGVWPLLSNSGGPRPWKD